MDSKIMFVTFWNFPIPPQFGPFDPFILCKVIEHTRGISFGGIHNLNIEKSTLTIINETGLEKIKASEKDNLSTESIYDDSSCMEIIALSDIRSVK